MQIILVQAEIEQALKDFITERITLTNGSTIQIELSATRGADGYKATIDILPADTITTPAAKPAVSKPAAPVTTASVAEEVPVSEPVEEVAEAAPAETTLPSETAEAPKSLFAGISRPKNN